jgi:hypothetical protein
LGLGAGGNAPGKVLVVGNASEERMRSFTVWSAFNTALMVAVAVFLFVVGQPLFGVLALLAGVSFVFIARWVESRRDRR